MELSSTARHELVYLPFLCPTQKVMIFFSNKHEISVIIILNEDDSPSYEISWFAALTLHKLILIEAQMIDSGNLSLNLARMDRFHHRNQDLSRVYVLNTNSSPSSPNPGIRLGQMFHCRNPVSWRLRLQPQLLCCYPRAPKIIIIKSESLLSLYPLFIKFNCAKPNLWPN